MKLPGILIFLALAFSSLAFEDLGPLAIVRQKRPELFVPGRISSVTINAVPCYVFAGQAEQCFIGEFSESSSELYEEAALAAKNFFYESFSQKGFETTVTMSNCSVLYRFNDTKIYTVTLFVPKKNVAVSKRELCTEKIATSPTIERQMLTFRRLSRIIATAYWKIRFFQKNNGSKTPDVQMNNFSTGK